MAIRWRWPPDNVRAALADHGVVTLRKLEDEVVRARKLGRGNYRLHRRGGVGQRDIVPDGPVEENVLLQDNSRFDA